MTLQKTSIPANYNSVPQPNWRVCSPYKVIKNGDEKHPMDLAIQAYSGVVMGIISITELMVYMPKENLTDLIDIGAQIKIARIQHGLTMTSLAKKLGVTVQAIRYWESGTRQLRNHKARISIENVLGIHVPATSYKQK